MQHQRPAHILLGLVDALIRLAHFCLGLLRLAATKDGRHRGFKHSSTIAHHLHDLRFDGVDPCGPELPLKKSKTMLSLP